MHYLCYSFQPVAMDNKNRNNSSNYYRSHQLNSEFSNPDLAMRYPFLLREMETGFYHRRMPLFYDRLCRFWDRMSFFCCTLEKIILIFL